MAAQDIAEAIERVRSVLLRRPQSGLHDDAPATSIWSGGTRVIARHDNGTEVASDMPGELGGSGDRVSPGWLLRAGFASCTATCIAMNAAVQGLELEALEVRATSRSDTRGLLGMADADGQPVPAGPGDMQMHVRISAPGVTAERLRALVEDSYRRSPIACAVENAVPVRLSIDVGDT
jgi:uncharacterized OsmC-like protein